MKKAKEVQSYYISLKTLTISTGLVAGIFGAIIGYLGYFFNFTEIDPDMILSIFKGQWTERWPGKIVAILIYGLLSILPAFFYYGLLRKMESFIWGAIFGLGMFVLIFLLLPPFIPGLELLHQYNFITIVYEICFFIIYGIFIGYSISYEYNEQQYRKEIVQENS